VWPVTLANDARRMRTELAVLVVLADLLLHFADAPEPNSIGKRVLEEHWTDSIGTLREHAERARTAAADIKESLFSDGAVSRDALRTIAEHFVARIGSIEPFDFGALRKLRYEINELVMTVLKAVVDHAI